MSTSDYSEDSIPLALPSPGDTSTPARPVSESATEVEGLTIAEAASAYGVSVSNIRRLIKPHKGEPPKVAAALVPSPKGATFRILPGEMEKLGYKVKTTQAGAILTAATAAAVRDTHKEGARPREPPPSERDTPRLKEQRTRTSHGSSR